MTSRNLYTRVYFGGAWVEDLQHAAARDAQLAVLADAVAETPERDVRSSELEAALTYVAERCHRGPAWARQFRDALTVPDPVQRQAAAEQVLGRIRRGFGL